MKKHNGSCAVTVKVMFGIAAVIFFSAVVLLGVLSGLDVDARSVQSVFLTSALLAAVAAPCVFWLVCTTAREEIYPVDAVEDMNALTVTDPLTHVLNRRGITMGVLEAMAQAERYNTPLSVAMIDVDNFQRINDEFGRATGDKVLADIAAALADSVRMPDKIGRFGGEEFLAVLPHTALVAARKIAERIRAAVHNAKLTANGKRVGLTVSIGVMQYTKGKDLEHLLSRTNAAVDQAKRDGGNRVVAAKKSR